jgi:hypothetical protein
LGSSSFQFKNTSTSERISNKSFLVQEEATENPEFLSEESQHDNGARSGTLNVYRPMTRNNILIYILQDAILRSLFYLETALYFSGGTITHRQERKQLYLQHFVFVTTQLLSAAIVEGVELVLVWCGWRQIAITL